MKIFKIILFLFFLTCLSCRTQMEEPSEVESPPEVEVLPADEAPTGLLELPEEEGEPGDEFPTDPNDLLDDEGNIYVKVENASAYSNVVEVVLMEYDERLNINVELARVSWEDGGFTIVGLNNITPNDIVPLINGHMHPTSIRISDPTVNVSDKNVKLTNAKFWGVDKDGNMVTRFAPFKVTNYGFTEAFFTYVDSDVTVSGKVHEFATFTVPEENYGYSPVYHDLFQTYSVEWKRGWNIWFYSASLKIGTRYVWTPELSVYLDIGPSWIETEKWLADTVYELKWYGGAEKLRINY